MSTKSNALQALLGANKNVTKDVPVKRLGVNFTVKAIDSETIERATAECTFGNGKAGKQVHEHKLGAALIAKACVEPNFADRTLIDHYEAEDAIDCVRKALLAGEIAKINAVIMEISGFGEDDVDFPNS
jgi:hypothetical protein